MHLNNWSIHPMATAFDRAVAARLRSRADQAAAEAASAPPARARKLRRLWLKNRWEAAELIGPPPLPTPTDVAARLRAGVCPGCGVGRTGRCRVCPSCRAAGRDYCPSCLRITRRAEMVARRDYCRPCRRVQARHERGYTDPQQGKVVMQAGGARGAAAIAAAHNARTAEMAILEARGWTRAEIARRFGVSENAVRQRLSRWRRRGGVS
jgi:hypothetical protein